MALRNERESSMARIMSLSRASSLQLCAKHRVRRRSHRAKPVLPFWESLTNELIDEHNYDILESVLEVSM